MKRKNSIKGSLTVEAAVCLPIFMAFILLIGCIARVYYIHEVVQDALSDAVNEVASTAYIFQITGVADTRNEIKGVLQEKAEIVHSQKDDFLNLIDMTKEVGGDVQGLDLESLKMDLSSGKESGMALSGSLKESIQDPRSYAKSLAAAGIDFAAQSGEELIMGLYIKALMEKHLETKWQTADERLKGVHIENGYGGLDFVGSTYFRGNEDLNVYVHYTLERIDPFGLVKNVKITNHVLVRGWMTGEGEIVGTGEVDDTEKPESEATDETAPAETEENNNDEAFKEDDNTTDNSSEVEEDEWKTRKKYLTSFGSEVYHTNPKCGANMDNATLYEGEFLDLPGGKNDKFEYNGKIYSYCTRCDDGLFND